MTLFVVGPLPFGADAEDQMTLFKSICEDSLVFHDYVTDEDVKELISGLLERKTDKRLGAGHGGAKEIKEQSYFTGFKWDALAGGFHEPPYKPDADELMKNWEEPDELMKNIGSSTVTFPKSMEWAKGF